MLLSSKLERWNPGIGTALVCLVSIFVYVNTAITFHSLSFTAEQLASITSSVVGEWDVINAIARAFHHESIYHLIGNIIGVVFVGGLIEKQIGSVSFVLSLIGACACAGFSAVIHQQSVCVGLSGSIYALAFLHAFLNRYLTVMFIMLAFEVAVMSVLHYPVDIANHILGACYGWFFGVAFLSAE